MSAQLVNKNKVNIECYFRFHLFFLPYTATVPPSSSLPVSPSSLCYLECFAPAERVPSANAACPAPREPAGGEVGGGVAEEKWRGGGGGSVKSGLGQQRKKHRSKTVFRARKRTKAEGLTFLFSSWISAWVTACLIWSFKKKQIHWDQTYAEMSLKGSNLHTPPWTCEPVSRDPALRETACPGSLPGQKPQWSWETPGSSPALHRSHIHLSAEEKRPVSTKKQIREFFFFLQQTVVLVISKLIPKDGGTVAPAQSVRVPPHHHPCIACISAPSSLSAIVPVPGSAGWAEQPRSAPQASPDQLWIYNTQKETHIIRIKCAHLVSKHCKPETTHYLTVPLVLRRTDAAKLWVTPTRLVPSTSTIRSLTWILYAGHKNSASLCCAAKINNICSNST